MVMEVLSRSFSLRHHDHRSSPRYKRQYYHSSRSLWIKIFWKVTQYISSSFHYLVRHCYCYLYNFQWSHGMRTTIDHNKPYFSPRYTFVVEETIWIQLRRKSHPKLPQTRICSSNSDSLPISVQPITTETWTQVRKQKPINRENFSRTSFAACTLAARVLSYASAYASLSNDSPLTSCCTCAPPSKFDPVPPSGKSTALISASAFWDRGVIVHLNLEGWLSFWASYMGGL